MKKTYSSPHIVRSISEFHQLFNLPKPHNPLISVIDVDLLKYVHTDIWKHYVYDFYCISIKQGNNCQLRYGQKDYDFAEGVMLFTKPGQVFQLSETNNNPVKGYALIFKADLIRNYPLAKAISEHGFFSYQISEALHLSDTEQSVIFALMYQLQQELKANIDHFSLDIVVSQIDLLLNYSNRFYNRQFITRKTDNNDLLAKVETLLAAYFTDAAKLASGLPTVEHIAQELNVSPNYLSDMLRSTTGQTTQQHIHNKLIERSKELLTTTKLSVSEIAYQLGFGYPQSFSKLFKNKTNVSPLEFRQSFN